MSVIGYVTVEEADAYVSDHYTSDDDHRILWEDLDDQDKCVFLRNSFECIERLPFTGRRTDLAQATSFPRFPSTIVPGEVKCAQIENALALCTDANTSSSTLEFYQNMRANGVASYSIGNLSETLTVGSPDVYVEVGITSYKAKNLLARYLQGGYGVAR